MPPPLVDDNSVRKKGKKNPLSRLFDELRNNQDHMNEVSGDKEIISMKMADLNDLFNKMLQIDKYLKTKPLTLPEIYIWAKNIIKTLPIITLRDTEEMWMYDKEEGKYVPNAETYIKSLCTNEETGSARSSTPEVYKKLLLNIQGDTYKSRKEWEFPTNLVNLNNGLYCKADGKIYPHNPKYYFTYKLPFNFDPDADCPTFKNVVNNLFPEEKIRTVIKRWFGYHFMPGYPYQVYLHLCGASGSGKSHLLQGLYILLGKGNFTGFSLQDFEDRSSYATPSIYKKLGNICADMKTASVKDMSMMKKLVSTVDVISTRDIYGRTFEFVNSTKMTFVSNKMPIAKLNILADDAVTRRAMIIKVNKANFIAERIDEIIESEASGIFNWAMEGYAELIVNKSFGYDLDSMLVWMDNMEGDMPSVSLDLSELDKYPDRNKR